MAQSWPWGSQTTGKKKKNGLIRTEQHSLRLLKLMSRIQSSIQNRIVKIFCEAVNLEPSSRWGANLSQSYLATKGNFANL